MLDLHTRQTNIKCPVCGGRDRFSIYPEKEMWYCRKHTEYPHPHFSLKSLANHLGVEYTTEDYYHRPKEDTTLIRNMEILAGLSLASLQYVKLVNSFFASRGLKTPTGVDIVVGNLFGYSKHAGYVYVKFPVITLTQTVGYHLIVLNGAGVKEKKFNLRVTDTMSGGFVPTHVVQGTPTVIVEGVETGLAFSTLYPETSCVAALSSSNLLTAWKGFKNGVISPDRDYEEVINRYGIPQITVPKIPNNDNPKLDWNDFLLHMEERNGY